MQNQHLKLKELIWEITGECKNNCSYCGSKKTNDKTVSDGVVLQIANKIAKYPPNEINISGGDLC
jgi:MoaA/NifB/PqqE/SkfB family radical SAM enzyme